MDANGNWSLAEAAEARVRQAGVRTNPELSLDIENALGSGPFTGYGAAETTLSVSQDLELFGRRRARIDVARAEAGVAGLRRDAAGVEAASRLALAYAEAEAAQRRFALTEEMLSITLADGRAGVGAVSGLTLAGDVSHSPVVRTDLIAFRQTCRRQ